MYGCLELKTVLFENEWPKIRPVVLKLLNQETVTKQEWQDLFWTVHNLNSWAEKAPVSIQKALEVEIGDFIDSARQRILIHEDSQSLLRAYINEWQKFYDQSLYLFEPFRLIDGSSSGGHSSSSSIYRRSSPLPSRSAGSGVLAKKSHEESSAVKKMMLESWNKHIFSRIKERLQNAAMTLVLAERNGECFDAHLVIGVRESYVSLSCDSNDRLLIYRQYFEKAYLEWTENYYRGRASIVLHENGVQAYTRYVDQKLIEEEQRGRRYLETGPDSSSLQMLMEKCVEVLLCAFQDQILAECSILIKNLEIDRLRLMFRLMNRTSSGIDVILKRLEDHIREQGLVDMLQNAGCIVTDPEKYVEQLLSMFSKFSRLVKDAFYDDPRFLTSRDKAFQDVVNDTSIFRLEINNPCSTPSHLTKSPITPHQKSSAALHSNFAESKCPELLANYCDLLLRKSSLSKKLTSDEIDLKLQDVLLVLKYVQNKDVFMKFHKTHLLRRLVFHTSIDQEKEGMTVSKLRESGMPADYINKFSRMLQDMDINHDLNIAFKAHMNSKSKSVVSDVVNLKILNSGAWSVRGVENMCVTLPRELEDFIVEAEEFYKTKHNGRKLRWCHQWSHGVLVFNSNKGKFELELTTFQMAVLMCWQDFDRKKISYESLRLLTELPDMDLRKILWSLIAAPKLKFQILLTNFRPNMNNNSNLAIASPRSSLSGKDFMDSTEFWPNDEFTLIKNNKSQSRGRLNLVYRLQMISGGDQQKMVEQEHEDIVQLRKFRIQEGIVKIMKARQRLSNNDLQLELIPMLKHMFIPDRKLIKEQIEWLIENKYLARDEKNINLFIYLS